jgi:membrane-associated phospholipid phosphatase
MRRVLLLAAAFAIVAVLVSLGAFTWLDQPAVRHAMPGLEPTLTEPVSAATVLGPVSGGHTPFDLASDIWLYPASVPLSLLALAVAAAVLARRGRVREAVLWLVAWGAANGVELLGKGLLRRPALSLHGVHVVGFDDSFPSGHAVRATIVVAALLVAVPAARKAVAVWAATVPPMLVAAGWHTPSDVIGGILLGLVCVAAVRYASRRWTASANRSTSSSVVSHAVIQRATPRSSSHT